MPFPTGHPNNPKGRRREIPGVIELMKAHTIDAARTLCRLAKGGKGIPRELALRAAVALLDRVHGLPRQALEVHSEEEIKFVMRLPSKCATAEEWERDCLDDQAKRGQPLLEAKPIEPSDPRQPIQFNGIPTPRS